MISVHTESPAEAMQAKFIFTRARAQDICLTDDAYRVPANGSAGADQSAFPRHSSAFWPELTTAAVSAVVGLRQEPSPPTLDPFARPEIMARL